MQVILPTITLYAAAGAWYLLRGRHTILTTAPEEVAARIASKLALRDPASGSGGQKVQRDGGQRRRWLQPLERFTAVILGIGVLSLGWMVMRAAGLMTGPPTLVELIVIVGVWSLLFVAVSIVGLASTSRQ